MDSGTREGSRSTRLMTFCSNERSREMGPEQRPHFQLNWRPLAFRQRQRRSAVEQPLPGTRHSISPTAGGYAQQLQHI
jgi:hypothetical protein